MEPETTLDGPAFTIADFCEHYAISRTLFYSLRKIQAGPEVIFCKRAIRITFQARMAWEARMRDAAQHAGMAIAPASPRTAAPTIECPAPRQTS
ncbi:hypothetical protein Cmtc_17040 [Cupriavidus sp. TKC]|uniref:hypothetical protein n=1 Tax=Cupriavidus sp. TKC TaxID=2880159 RepID=UPI0025A77A84|nr:hypothetical protein [Cupriavidus sp. TKC]GMG90484.1 hypothetical protein Cmtc_17040 [Cupriavidus sp. TKC]